MESGRIAEQGRHKELLRRRGFYYDLYNSQFADAVGQPRSNGRRYGR
jgi:ATP-binding cassette subfamily B protein